MPLTIDLINEIASKRDQQARTSKRWKEANDKYTALFSAEFSESWGTFGIGTEGEVKSLRDVPRSHREGSLFLTSSSNMNWSSQRD